MKQELIQKQKLPESWRWDTLDNTCFLVTGGTPSKSVTSYWKDGNINWLVSGDVNKQFIYEVSGKITKEGMENSNTKIIPSNSIIIALNGQGKTRGTVAVLKIESTCNQSVVAFIPKEKNELNYMFLFYYLKNMYQKLRNITGDNERSGLSMRILKKFPILLPLLPVQQQIVSKLDAQMAQIEIMKKEAEKEEGAIRDMIYSVSDNLFNNSSSNKYPLKTIKDVCIKITDGTHRTPQYIKTGIPFLSVKDIRETGISFEDTRFISLEEHKELTKRCNPEKGDILYTKVGTTGIAKEIDVDNEFSIFVSVALLKVNKNIIRPSFFEKVLNSPSCKKQAEKYTQGIGNKNLVLQDLSKIEFYLPPLKIQDEIIKKHKDLSKEIYYLLEHITQKLSAISQLPSSLLNEVFGKYEIPEVK